MNTDLRIIAVSTFFIAVMVAIWLDVLLLGKRSPTPDRFGWRIRSALLLTALSIVVWPIMLSGHTKESALKTQCMSNSKQYCLALIIYSADYDDFFPLPFSWEDHTNLYRKDPLRCQMNGIATGYAFNANSTKIFTIEKDTETLLLGESAVNNKNVLIRTQNDIVARHKTPIIGFVDGHVKAFSRDVNHNTAYLRATDSLPISIPIPPPAFTEITAKILRNFIFPAVAAGLGLLALIYSLMTFLYRDPERRSLGLWIAVLLGITCYLVYFPPVY